GELAVVRNPAGQDYSGTITVPSTANGYTVKYIATHAFGYVDGSAVEDMRIESVDLPGTIVSFANCAFQNNRSLKSIVIPNSVVALSDDNFNGTDTEVGATFMNCTSLEEVTIGAGVTNLAFTNGLFNNMTYDGASSLKKLTILAPTPPTIDGNTFLVDLANAVLFVPADAVEAYQNTFGGTEGWWMFTHGTANIYAVGTCVPPWGLSVDENNVITWKGVANGGYDVAISSTELSNPTASAHVGSESYNASDDIQQEGVYYIYVRGACSDNNSEWVSTSIYHYPGAYCDYNVSGITTYTNDSGEPDTTVWTSSVELWQNGYPIATVAGAAAFAGATVQLIPNAEVTVKWVGGNDYDDPCTLLIKQGETVILSKEDLVDNVSSDNVGTFTPSCSD
ncbi:MAG: leucine-rich repeat domain-containing protein, partial [Prevotellaceae bacterium]|nr:leucine-rich repeat domain-containing protein [Prevotellaceae bacterium]